MKSTHLMVAAAMLVGALNLNAQDADKAARPGNPLFAALDANHDGTIDQSEISNAPAALRKLDKDGDGKLSRAELRPGAAQKQGAKAEKKAKKKDAAQ